jgi:hypothetical protein
VGEALVEIPGRWCGMCGANRIFSSLVELLDDLDFVRYNLFDALVNSSLGSTLQCELCFSFVGHR